MHKALEQTATGKFDNHQNDRIQTQRTAPKKLQRTQDKQNELSVGVLAGEHVKRIPGLIPQFMSDSNSEGCQ